MALFRSPAQRRVAKVAATVLVLTAVAVLFTRALTDNWQRVTELDLRVSWLWALGAALFASAVVLSGLLWRKILLALAPEDFSVSVVVAVRVNLASWLLKYVPGGVGSLVNKVIWGKGVGLSRGLVVITFVYENVFLQVASIVPSLAILLVILGPDLFGQNWGTLVLPVVALIPLAAVLVPSWFHRVLQLASQLVLKRPIPPGFFLSGADTVKLLGEFLLPRLVNAAGFIVLSHALLPITVDQWPLLGASYVLAGAVGILAVFVPSGVGVREAVLFACLVAGGVGAPDAVILSVVSRLVSSAADLFIAAVYGLLRLRAKKVNTQ